ncbi:MULTISPECIES: hypothetical protein [Streptomyces]|uniref:hypothetical protein n=1 Tax=Streptomyces TaxID=1883 RepID=UPI000DF9FDDD|nr:MULTISPECIES: hypothetical protein [Streptomyces]MBT3077643.1 hypothetical protein [Streptomyces sp. COG21]MBT3084489.1 hypothetical protein [Streptomyces sp. COG20]MBT3085396.1 hypothetical protein [Streptomyces sp. CYG21]MBT3098989.1 hypothetical protein [Streptomyces sp. CBG30]MBT3103562.1 hypothetical protein [Streptomyces sp. COG19]
MSDTVKMKLTFPRGKQMPGEIVEVAADEVHRWKGYAEPVDDKVDEPAKTSADKNPTTGSVPQKAAGK